MSNSLGARMHCLLAVFCSFATLSGGRIAETVQGAGIRLWDFETGHFRWTDTAETLNLKNEGSAPLHLVEIEIQPSVAIN